MPKYSPIISEGVQYSRGHLQPFREILEGDGKGGNDLIVRVSFQSHVYSVAAVPNSLAHTFQDEADVDRDFCPIRHGWSLDLPKHCKKMIHNNFPTWKSQDRNQTHHLTVTDFPVVSGDAYHIFYEVYPSRAEGVHVELQVKSAYKKHLFAENTGKRNKVRQMVKKAHFEGKRLP